MLRDDSDSFKAFCLALPAAMLSALGWVALVIEVKDQVTGGQGFGIFAGGTAGTFALVYGLSWMGFRGSAAAFGILWVIVLATANGLTVAGFAATLAALDVCDRAVVLPAAVIGGAAGAALAAVWVAAAGRRGDSGALAMTLGRKGLTGGFLTGFVLAGLGGLLLFGSGFAAEGAKQSDLTVKGPGGVAGILAAFAFPAIAGGVTLGYLGGFLGVSIGMLLDLCVASREPAQTMSSYAPSSVMEKLAAKIVEIMTST